MIEPRYLLIPNTHEKINIYVKHRLTIYPPFILFPGKSPQPIEIRTSIELIVHARFTIKNSRIDRESSLALCQSRNHISPGTFPP